MKSKRTMVFKICTEKAVVRRGLHIGGKETEQVKACRYKAEWLGPTTDAKCHREIKRRIAIGKRHFQFLNENY